MLRLNTSNPNKMKEFRTFFADEGLVLHESYQDIKEIKGTPLQVIVHKASTLGTNILVEDTSLDIPNEKIGINIRWLLDHVATLIGKKARWTVLLACQKEDGLVYVYKGNIDGHIVKAKGNSFGFDPFFQPIGSTQTLAENKEKKYNARALAVKAFVENNYIAVEKPILNWQGPWQ